MEVDDGPLFYAAAIVSCGVSYDAATGDALALVDCAHGHRAHRRAAPFTVTAFNANLAPAGGVTVTYSVASGTARLACGNPVCAVTATGDGRATMNATAVDGTLSVVTASLTNGAACRGSLPEARRRRWPRSHPSFTLLPAPVSPGRCRLWCLRMACRLQARRLHGNSGSGITTKGAATATTNATGIATETLTVGPLAEGQQASIPACLNGTGQCVSFAAFGDRPEYAQLESVSGASQDLSLTATPSQIVLRLLDMNGNPMAGGTVELYQALYAWTPPCSPHAICAPGALLGTQAGSATSAVDGAVIFAPATLHSVATQLEGIAVSGNTAMVSIAVEQH